MKQFIPLAMVLALITDLSPTPLMAQAAGCFADYKAKQDQPLKLHYGVIELSGECSREAAKTEISRRISSQGWTLLNVLSIFDENGLDQRKDNAGQYYLRF